MRNTVEGTTFKRCTCRTPQGKPLGTKCLRLRRPSGAWNSAHGLWGFQIELPRTAEGKRRQARRTGLADQGTALAELDRIKALLGVAGEDEQAAVCIADAIQKTLKARKPLPTVEEVRRLIGAPARERAEVPTLGEWLQEWLEAKTRLAAGTRRSYLGHITNHIAPAIGWVRLDR